MELIVKAYNLEIVRKLTLGIHSSCSLHFIIKTIYIYTNI